MFSAGLVALGAQISFVPAIAAIPEILTLNDAVALALRYNMRMVFGTVRMYSRSEPPISLNRVFGVTSFELG